MGAIKKQVGQILDEDKEEDRRKCTTLQDTTSTLRCSLHPAEPTVSGNSENIQQFQQSAMNACLQTLNGSTSTLTRSMANFSSSPESLSHGIIYHGIKY